MKRILVVGILATLAAVPLFWLTPPAPAPSPAPQEQAAASPVVLDAREATQALPAAAVKRAAAPAALPLSFRGTRIDGELPVDASGNLVVTEGVRRLFDYFLSTLGEEPLSSSVLRLRTYLEQQLPPAAAAQAGALLTRYLDCKRQLLDLERGFPRADDIDALQRRLQAVQALRARLFSPQTHQAFFAVDEQYDRYGLERLAIRLNPALTAQQKGQALDRLHASLPDELKDAIVPGLQQVLREQSARLQASGGTPLALRQLRQQLVGNAATQRLEVLDASRDQWRQRLAAYRVEKRRIEASRGLSEQDKTRAVAQLAAERFDETERLRLDAAERLAAAREG